MATTLAEPELALDREPLQTAQERLAAHLTAIDRAWAEYIGLQERMAAEDNQRTREALRTQAMAASVRLSVAPAEARHLAERYARLLIEWAHRADEHVRRELAAAAADYEQPARARARALGVLDLSRPVRARDEIQEAAARVELEQLNAKLAPIEARRREAERLRDQTRCELEARFGDLSGAPDVPAHAVARYVRGVEAAARRRATGG